MKNEVLIDCKKMFKKGESYKNIINYLFDMDYYEEDIIKIFEEMGVDKRIIVDLLQYDFGLDLEDMGI